MKRTMERQALDRMLVRDFNVKWDDARRAINRYYVEAYGKVPQWYDLIVCDPYAVTEWIYGTRRYWVPYGKPWTIKLPEGWPW